MPPRSFTSQELILDAVMISLTRIKNALFSVALLIVVGLYSLIDGNLSWNLARIEARHAVVAAIEKANATQRSITGSVASDAEAIAEMNKSAASLEQALSEKEIEMPLLGLRVSTQDLSVLLMLGSVVVLLWLLFCQRRLQSSIKALERIAGTEIVLTLLEHHFALIGGQTTRLMKLTSRALLMGLPVLSLLFVVSDIHDLYGIWNDPVKSLAFTGPAYVRNVVIRLLLGVGLGFVVALLGRFCYQEFLKTESDLRKYSSPSEPA